MANNKTIKTYQRLLRKTVAEMAAMKPGTDPARVAILNKRFKKYDEKVKLYGTKN